MIFFVLEVDWSSIRYFPADVIGAGKVIFFASVLNGDRTPYHSDFRGMLKSYAENLKNKQGMTAYAASEIEGFLVDGQNAEQRYGENGFQLRSLVRKDEKRGGREGESGEEVAVHDSD